MKNIKMWPGAVSYGGRQALDDFLGTRSQVSSFSNFRHAGQHPKWLREHERRKGASFSREENYRKRGGEVKTGLMAEKASEKMPAQLLWIS
ncbi:MAG TPA: hypothetical protein VKS20_00325 [Candidatus Acidoferrales bacterium]|nr:hypothetical protein [Candidatus Acidoferrales bacterium]